MPNPQQQQALDMDYELEEVEIPVSEVRPDDLVLGPARRTGTDSPRGSQLYSPPKYVPAQPILPPRHMVGGMARVVVGGEHVSGLIDMNTRKISRQMGVYRRERHGMDIEVPSRLGEVESLQVCVHTHVQGSQSTRLPS